MKRELRLMAVLAHPDDESLGFGGTIAKYAAEGVGTYLTTATRGERGRFGPDGKRGEPEEVGRVRESELREAAAVGAIVGAVTGGQAMGPAVRVLRGAVVTFRLDRPLDVGVADSGINRGGYHYHECYPYDRQDHQ